MILLPKESYSIALNALSAVSINKQFALSVANNRVAGRIYADCTDSPSVFHVVHPYGMSLLYGNVTHEFICRDFRQYMLGRDGLRTSTEHVQVFPPELEIDIDTALGPNLCKPGVLRSNCIVHKYKRVNFRFCREKFHAFLRGLDLDRYSFLPVDEEIFSDFTGTVVPSKFWHSGPDFVNRGVGFVVMESDQPAALAFSAFLNDGVLELGMETREPFRRRGLGTVVCAKLIDHCLKSHLSPDWACSSKNSASFNLAVKLGFEPIRFLPYYECFIRQ